MGSAAQRIEILLIGLMLLIAGAIAAVLLLVRPTVPHPIEQPPAAVIVTPAVRPSTVLPLSPTALPPGPELGVSVATVAQRVTSLWEQLPAASVTLLLLALLGVGSAAILLMLLRRRGQRRPAMAHTGQSVGMLLDAADPETRQSNLRVLQDLAARGLLTPDLAAAASLGPASASLPAPRRPALPRLPSVALPRLALPALRLPHVRMPTLRLRLRRVPPPTLALDPVAPLELPVAHSAPAPAPVPVVETASEDDLVLTVAAALLPLLATLRSEVLAIDTARWGEGGEALVTLDVVPGEEAELARLVEQLASERTTWRIDWRNGALALHLPVAEAPMGGPPLLAILDHGRGNRMTRWLPLRRWPHLGIYGDGAALALHAILGTLLYAQAPDRLALAILDRGELAPLYRDAPHLLALPADRHGTLDRLLSVLRAGTYPSDARPLLLVVYDPDEAELAQLATLLQRLRQAPTAPLHLLLVQPVPRAAGRDLYALLPTLVVGSASAPAEWLPGEAWARPSEARFVARELRCTGRRRTLDEAAIAALLAPLRGLVSGRLPPVLWDQPASMSSTPALPDLVLASDMQHDAGVSAPDDDPATRPVQHDHPIGTPPGEQNQPVELSLVPAPEPGAQEDASPPGVDEAASSSAPSAWDQPITFTSPADWVDRLGEVRTFPAALAQATDLSPASIGDADHPWPIGPCEMRPDALAALFELVLNDPIFNPLGRPDQAGLSKGRLLRCRTLLPAASESAAQALLVWCELAGLLDPPIHVAQPFRDPRRLNVHDLEQIAARLRATPLPDRAAVRAAFGGVL